MPVSPDESLNNDEAFVPWLSQRPLISLDRVLTVIISEFFRYLSDWESLDTWIAATGALAAMACALPGTWLVLRRQSLLGDALSHAVLPGIVMAYLAVSWMEDAGWLAGATPDSAGVSRVAEGMSFVARRQLALFIGAALSGIVAALLSEGIQRWGRVERSAALGVVFTSMFALGLLLIRLFADRAHLDPSCVLYGSLESTGMAVVAGTRIPQAALSLAFMLLVNGALIALFFKELQLNTFDPELGASQGLRPTWMSLVLMSMTAATVVAAFESVGAILVIAMLIAPGATARLLTDRLSTMLALSLVVAAAGAVLGHALAITVPAMIGVRIGFPEIRDSSTAGMMAVSTCGLFVAALLASPRHGMLFAWWQQVQLRLRIAQEDLLGRMYRSDEAALTGISASQVDPAITLGPRSGWLTWLAWRRLVYLKYIRPGPTGDSLTATGAVAARSLVRSHRLWEAYMARHFNLPGDHLHATAEQVEHFLSPELQAELAAELDQPVTDPHGKSIPSPDDWP